MAARKKETLQITISQPNMQTLPIPVQGTSCYVSNKFSSEARQIVRDNMAEGASSKATRNKREPKDFEKLFRESMHVCTSEKKPWYGIPCTAFRSAMIRAAQLCGVPMTLAKMTVFVEPDGFGEDGTPLVKITEGTPRQFEAYARTPPGPTGTPNISSRGQWLAWGCTVRVKFDASFIAANDVVNLLSRAGISVGVGAGRPFSTSSEGQGWGTFRVDHDKFSKENSGTVQKRGSKQA